MTLSVSGKLSLLAGMSLLAIALLSVVSHVEMTRVYVSASYANDNTVPSLLVLDQAADKLASRRARFWQRLLQSDPEQIAEIELGMQQDRQAIDVALKDYEPLLSDDKDRSLLSADKVALKAMDELYDKALTRLRANQRDEARDLVMANRAIILSAVTAFEAHAASQAIVEQAKALTAVIARYNVEKEASTVSAKPTGPRTTVTAERRGPTRLPSAPALRLA